MARILAASCGFTTDPKLAPEARLEANRRMILEALDGAAKFQPDFICLPELVLQYGCGDFGRMAALAEPVPEGPTVELVARKARAMNTHIILPLFEKEGDRVFNTAALIGRDGRLIGKYRKVHATGYEIADGVTPGVGTPVWSTDRGRVGIAICFDLKFPDIGLALSRGAAQCVFFPTMFFGGQRLVAWAMDYGFHLVRCHAAGGRIVDPTGATVAIEGAPEALSAEGSCVKWTFAQVNLDHQTYHFDFHRQKMEALTARYGAGVLIRRMPEEGTFSIESNLPDKTVDDLEAEFELKSLRTYLDESISLREAALREAARA
jgi:predicted amidohydrolase